VVVSDNPEMARFVPRYGVGAVFAGNDAGALAGAVREVGADHAAIRSRLADPDLLAELSWERQVETLLDVYAAAGVRL
jgi:glycosyltransferase involved in cell wall biosynthesis